MNIKIKISNRAFFFICFFVACALMLIAAITLGIGGVVLAATCVLTGGGMIMAIWEEDLKHED